MENEIPGIRFTSNLDEISSLNLQGFFVDWPNPPNTKTHLAVLAGCQYRLLAIDNATGDVVGFITVLTDGVLIAYISLLEVLPEFQDRGIGSKLVKDMLAILNQMYAIDLLCDDSLVSFYEKFGLKKARGMALRNYGRQSGPAWKFDQGE